MPKTIVVDGRPTPPADGCEDWAAGWPAEVLAAHPDVAVLFLGIGEQYDALVGGTVISFGTPEYSRYLDDYLDQALADLAAAAPHVAVVNLPCHRVVEDGSNEVNAIIDDQTRIDWLNTYLAAYQRRSSTSFTLLDLDKFLCLDGDPVQRDGVQMRGDGLHFTPEGASIVWRWLGPQLRAVAAGAAP